MHKSYYNTSKQRPDDGEDLSSQQLSDTVDTQLYYVPHAYDLLADFSKYSHHTLDKAQLHVHLQCVGQLLTLAAMQDSEDR